MKRLIGILGGIAALWSILVLVTDDFGGDLSSEGIARFALAAFAGGFLLYGVRRDGKYPWWKHTGRGSDWADVAKYAIDSDAKTKRGDA